MTRSDLTKGQRRFLRTRREVPSLRWEPMQRDGDFRLGGEPVEHWENRRYYATVQRFDAGFFIGGGPYVRIGVSSRDELARHDWRDLQRIKNDLCGPEWEAVELYPAESRLVDPSNRFYLWAVPPGVLAGLGWGYRYVLDQHDAETLAPQRPFAPQDRPDPAANTKSREVQP